MVTLEISSLEQQTLTDVLECAISEIHSQIVHADRSDFKALLKSRKQVMLQLLENLKQATAAEPA
jgi:hypothetical protein